MEFIPNHEESILISSIQNYSRNEFTLVRLTRTMLDKSIIDANSEIVNLLKKYDILNYDELVDGLKIYRNSLISLANEVREVKTSFYRPKAKPKKPGDPRFWPSKLGGLLAVDTMMYITVQDSSLVIIPLVESACENNLLEDIFGKLEDYTDSYNEILVELASIQDKWIKSCSPYKRHHKDVGDTLEEYFQIPVNNSGKADYKEEIEFKSKRRKSKTKDTLFSQVPDWELSTIKSAKSMILTYGYNSRHKNRQGYKDLYVSVTTKPNPQGLYLETDDVSMLLRQFYTGDDKNSMKPIDPCVWEYEILKSRLYEKHPKTMWVVADEEVINGEIHFRYNSVEFTERPIFSQFISLIDQNIICYDWRGSREIDGKGREDKGHAFRLNSAKNRKLLFGEVQKIDLCEFS